MIYTTLRCGKEVVAEGDSEKIYNKMMKVVMMLPKECQMPYYLMKLRGFSVGEVAMFLECTEGEVRRRVEDALAFIRLNSEDIRIALKEVRKVVVGG